jgi:hypothetical protein
MGWWSVTILGGDTPYDAHGWVWDRVLSKLELGTDYSDILDEEDSPFNHDDSRLRRAFTPEFQRELLDAVKQRSQAYDQRTVYAQVLALMSIESGAGIPEDLKKEFIELCADDEWARDDKDRAMYVLDLCRSIEQSEEGQLREFPQEGLFDQLAAMVGADEGKPNAGAVLTESDFRDPQYKLEELTNA